MRQRRFVRLLEVLPTQRQILARGDHAAEGVAREPFAADRTHQRVAGVEQYPLNPLKLDHIRLS